MAYSRGWELYQVHREEVLETDEKIFGETFLFSQIGPPTTGDSPLGPVGVLGLGETGKGMKLGEVRVDRTSVAYLVHAVEGGGPVHRHGGLLPWLGDQPGPKGRTTSAWELVQGRLGGPVPCLRTTRSTGEDRPRPGTRPWDP